MPFIDWAVETNFKLEGIFPVISGGGLMSCILFLNQLKNVSLFMDLYFNLSGLLLYGTFSKS